MTLRTLLSVLVLTPLTSSAADAAPSPSPSIAYPAFGLLEGSGLVASAQHPGVVWVVEDSGAPVVHAYGPEGVVAGTLTMLPTGSADTWGGDIRDAESLALGPGPTLWVADIGDNNAVRESVVVHAMPEPAQLGDVTENSVSYRFTYPAGPRDAEAFLVDPTDGRVYIVTKGLLGGGLYAGPSTLTPNASSVLEFVQDAPGIVSDGSFSPDGAHIVLRTVGFGAKAYLYDVKREQGKPVNLAPDPVEIDLPDQVQGESICFTPDGTALLIGSEGRDEPIWSVPIPDGALPTTASPHESSGMASAEPGGATSGTTGSARGDSRAPTGWIFGWAVALAGAVVLIAVGQRRRRRTVSPP